MLLICLVLGGCASSPPPESASLALAPAQLVEPTSARKSILAQRSRMWKDPDSIRDARIGRPHACQHPTIVGGRFTSVPASCVCLELNAKNSYGGYVGMKRTIVAFVEGREIDTVDGGVAGFQDYCQDLAPFPELNGKR